MTDRGNVYSWGRGTSGQLGHGDTVDRFESLRRLERVMDVLQDHVKSSDGFKPEY